MYCPGFLREFDLVDSSARLGHVGNLGMLCNDSREILVSKGLHRRSRRADETILCFKAVSDSGRHGFSEA
jgi:hypothetical protein